MAYGTEISAEKSKIMTYSMNIIGADISINGQMLEEVTILSTWDLATLCKDGTCSAEVCIRIASAMAAMARLKRIWRCNTISFASKVRLYIIIIIINPLTARVVEAPQMILQPVFSIFPCSPLPSGTCQTPGLSIP